MKNLKFLKINQKFTKFYNFPNRNLYIANRGRPSRETAMTHDPKGNVPDIIYFNQMKEFIKESQGVPPYSQKWVELRNKHYKILHQKAKETSEKFKQSLDTQYLRFYVLIVPEQTQSYELVSILNFCQIRYKALEDSPVSKSIMKQMLGSSLGMSALYGGLGNSNGGAYSNYKSFNFPFLIFETSEEPTKTFEGYDNILEFFIENNFIHDFRSHTVYEKEGVAFCREVEKCLENLMKMFGNRFSFYFRSTNFKEARYWYHPFKDSYVYRNRIVSRIYRLGRDLVKDLKFYMQGRAKKKAFFEENEKNLTSGIKTWIERLNGRAFHGGDIPDAADFRMYSIWRKYSNCRKINFWLKNMAGDEWNDEVSTDMRGVFTKFSDWDSRMYMLCSRSNFYNIREVGYNYNRYMSEDILENERINKPVHETQEKENNTGEFETSLGLKTKSTTSTPIMGVFGNKIRRNKINF